MKKTYFTPSLLVIAALLGACSSTPTSTGLLDQTRSDYQTAQSNPKVANYASAEMKQADTAMDQANRSASNNDNPEKVDKLAYLAKQKIALTQEVAKQKSAEADVQNANNERDHVLLNQRTYEADRAKRATQIAQSETARAQFMTQEAQAHATVLEAQLAELAARQTERGYIITLGDVLFGTDLTRLNAEGMRTAEKLAVLLQQNQQRVVIIEGFTDSTGSALHNQDLSERRALSVRNVLHEMGVPRDRIAVRGYGEDYPVAANDTAANRQLNRRVEIVLSNANGMIPQR